jgi:hypothetical protein
MGDKDFGKGFKLVLPPALGSYADIFTARQIKGSTSGPKFSISLLWDKTAKVIGPIRQAIESVAIGKFGPKVKAKLAQQGSPFWNPLRDGDIEKPDDPLYAGKWFMNASSSKKPGIVNAQCVKVFEEEEAYSGCVYRASVNFFAFDKAGKQGVGCGLNNLQVVSKGPRLDGRKDAEEEFKEFMESESNAEVDPIS